MPMADRAILDHFRLPPLVNIRQFVSMRIVQQTGIYYSQRFWKAAGSEWSFWVERSMDYPQNLLTVNEIKRTHTFRRESVVMRITRADALHCIDPSSIPFHSLHIDVMRDRSESPTSLRYEILTTCFKRIREFRCREFAA